MLAWQVTIILNTVSIKYFSCKRDKHFERVSMPSENTLHFRQIPQASICRSRLWSVIHCALQVIQVIESKVVEIES